MAQRDHDYLSFWNRIKMIFALKERLEHWPHRAITYILITFYLHCNQVFHFHAMQQKLKWDGNESKDEVDAQTNHAMVLIIVQLTLSSTWCILWDVIFWKSLLVSFVANAWWYEAIGIHYKVFQYSPYDKSNKISRNSVFDYNS